MSKETIKKSIEGGYDFERKEHDGLKPQVKFVRSEFETNERHKKLVVRAIYQDNKGKEYGSWVVFDEWVQRYKNRCFLDPKFWQALGKGLGWKDPQVKEEDLPVGYRPWWLEYQHRFIDHLAEEKEPNDFFKELLK